MKTAFTLIEIILVIVIISILAVAGISRLAGTYDDAKVAISLNDVGILINDLSTYYTTHERYNGNLSLMTYIKDINYTTPWNELNQKGVITYYTLDDDVNLEPCVQISIQNQDGNLTVSNIINPHGTICKTLQSINTYKQFLGTKLIGGNRIKF
jgi:prepilin-type N-terminal cleavage/methylation domain-containing protein